MQQFHRAAQVLLVLLDTLVDDLQLVDFKLPEKVFGSLEVDLGDVDCLLDLDQIIVLLLLEARQDAKRVAALKILDVLLDTGLNEAALGLVI